MPLVIAFIVTFTIVYIIQQRRGAIILDRLHRATLAGMAVAFLMVMVSLIAGAVGS